MRDLILRRMKTVLAAPTPRVYFADAALYMLNARYFAPGSAQYQRRRDQLNEAIAHSNRQSQNALVVDELMAYARSLSDDELLDVYESFVSRLER